MSKKLYLNDGGTIESLNKIKKIAERMLEEMQIHEGGIAEEYFEMRLKKIESNIEAIRRNCI